MSFYLIKGRFKPEAGIPDGDSVRFLANNLELWKKLEGNSVELGTGKETKNTAQLRFEGIDAIEKGAIKPLSSDATANMKKLIGYDKTNCPMPEGYLLTRMTDDKTRRPIAFAFAGKIGKQDGSECWLDGDWLKDSVNYLQMKAGFGYPLYYNTLYTQLRNTFNDALKYAKSRGLGYWPKDKTQSGLTVKNYDALATISPIWPKLWRRLQTYLRDHTSLAGFHDFLEEKNERIDVLSVMEERGLQDVVKISANRVWLTEPPENLRVRGKAGKRK